MAAIGVAPCSSVECRRSKSRRRRDETRSLGFQRLESRLNLTVIALTGDVSFYESELHYFWSMGGTTNEIVDFPIVLQNMTAEPSTLRLTSDIRAFDSNLYLVVGSSNITIDGGGYAVSIDGAQSYLGFVQNGTTSDDGFSNIAVRNLTVTSLNGSTLADNAGWVGQSYFGKHTTGCVIDTCSSNGPVSLNGGGIVGGYASASASNCHSSGQIGIYGGSIFGAYASGSTAQACDSTGAIGQFAGGVFGSHASDSVANACYSTGVASDYGGGIFGGSAEASRATNCYSVGAVGGSAGGIFGASTSQCVASTCYSLGDIGVGAGGIFGLVASQGIATNCYSVGVIATGAGGVFGDGGVACTATNCYTAGTLQGGDGGIYANDPTIPATCYSEGAANASGWHDANANATLLLVVSSMPIWAEIDAQATNVPYLLAAFNRAIYTENAATVVAGAGNYTALTLTATIAPDFRIMSVNGGYDPQITISNAAPHLGQMSSTYTQGGIKYVQVLNGTYVGSVPGGNVPYTYVGYNSNLVALTVLPAVSTFTVTTLGDTGASGTLRWAITQANAAAGTSVIEFAPTLRGTIGLGTALPAIARPVTVNGPGRSVITIAGRGRVADGFSFVAGSAGSTLRGVSLRGFRDVGVRLDDSPGVTITNVSVTGTGSPTSMGLYATGNLAGTTIESCLFTGCRRGAMLVNARDLAFGTIGRGNTLSNNRATLQTVVGVGIRAEGDLAGTLVAGNTFAGNRRGFGFVDASNLRLENNLFIRNRIAAIAVSGDNTGSSMAGNTFGAGGQRNGQTVQQLAGPQGI